MFHGNLWPVMIEETSSLYVLKCKKEGMQAPTCVVDLEEKWVRNQRDELKPGTYKNQEVEARWVVKNQIIWEAGNQ